MWQKAKHYEASDKPVGTLLSDNSEMLSVPQYSAGHTRHEYTTGTSQKLIFEQFGYVDWSIPSDEAANEEQKEENQAAASEQ